MMSHYSGVGNKPFEDINIDIRVVTMHRCIAIFGPAIRDMCIVSRPKYRDTYCHTYHVS